MTILWVGVGREVNQLLSVDNVFSALLSLAVLPSVCVAD